MAKPRFKSDGIHSGLLELWEFNLGWVHFPTKFQCSLAVKLYIGSKDVLQEQK